MAETDLPYGHFGRAEYDPDGRIWRFDRTQQIQSVWRPLGEPKVIVQPNDHGRVDQYLDETSSHRFLKQMQALLKAHPEVQPALVLLAPLARVSEAVEKATSRHDAGKGSLLGFGTVRSEADQHLVEIAAFAAGATGGHLRLVQVRMQRQGWRDSKDAWLEMPIIHGEEANWHGDGAAIQQICFGTTVEPSQNFVAVRLHARTVIFRPMIRKTVLPGTKNSRLDANPIFELWCDKAGMVPHAHISFNPWFNRQFAVVDQAGKCSVWEITGWTKMTAKCTFMSAVEDDSDKAKALTDGWARTMWVGGLMTLAICTRGKLVLSSLNTAGMTNVEIHIDSSTKGGWLLDIVTLQSHLDHLCVLTHNHILIYRVTGAEAGPIAQEVLRLKHYRSPDDLSLTLMTDACSKQSVMVNVSSKVDTIITRYQLDFDEDNGISVAGPLSLDLPHDINASTIDDWHMKMVTIDKREMTGNDSQLISWQEKNVRFASLFVFRKDFSLSQILYTIGDGVEVVVQSGPPNWERKLDASTSRVRSERFIVDDDDQDDLDGGQLQPRLRPVSVHVQRRIMQTRSASKSGSEWTVNLGPIARQLQKDQVVESQEVNTVLDKAQHLLQHQPGNTLPVQTIAELGRGELIVGDIEETSQRLADLALISPDDNIRPDHTDDEAPGAPVIRLALHALRWPLSLRSEVGQETSSLMDIYNTMVDDWITPLPAHVPGRVRLAKEELVRQAAAEVALASYVIRIEDVLEAVHPGEQKSQSFELPVRAGSPDPSQDLISSQPLPGSSQPLPSQRSVLPTPSATPSTATGTSYFTSFGAAEISRLSKYTTFSEPAPSSLPRALNRVLSHWEVGADPAEYDWRRTARQVSQRQEAEDIDQVVDERERERLRRKAEKLLRRQRREAAASEAARLASSQAPQLASFGRPQSQSQSRPQSRGVSGGAVPSATQVESQQVAQSSQSQGTGLGMPSASQVVPGRFGGRPAKKKRKQGF